MRRSLKVSRHSMNSYYWSLTMISEYPFQDLLEQGLAFGDSAEAREKPLAHSKAVATNFDEMIQKYDIDVIIAPGDCKLSTYAAAGGESIQNP